MGNITDFLTGEELTLIFSAVIVLAGLIVFYVFRSLLFNNVLYFPSSKGTWLHTKDESLWISKDNELPYVGIDKHRPIHHVDITNFNPQTNTKEKVKKIVNDRVVLAITYGKDTEYLWKANKRYIFKATDHTLTTGTTLRAIREKIPDSSPTKRLLK